MNKKHQALFLDRDGVINIDHGYVHTEDNFEFVDGIFELCKTATDLGYLIFVITNQAGIGRGYYTEDQFDDISSWMRGVFKSRGIEINKVYYCPYHPEHGVGEYKKHSECRKPEPGMILQAKQEFNIDLENSILVGDNESDIQAGINAGIRYNLLYQPGQKAQTNQQSASTAIIDELIAARNFLQSINSD